jgi:hypothetical protein
VADLHDIELALRVLRAGVPGDHPAIDEDTLDLWLSSLKSYGPVTVQRSAEQWVETEARFPSLQAFLSLVQETARTMAIERQALEQPAGWIGDADGFAKCAECGGTKHVEVKEPTRPGYVFVRPCLVCDPVQYERWRGGHFAPDHDRRNCPDEVCRTGKRKRA